MFPSPSILLLNKTCNLITSIQTRNVRAVTKIFRTKLPKSRVIFRDLPPMSKLLTGSDAAKMKLDELRRQKLETYRAFLPTRMEPVLLEALLDPNHDIDRQLRIIGENISEMNSFHLAISFEALDDTLRAGLCDIETVLVAPEFKALCLRTLYKVRFFEADEILRLIKCLSTLKIPEDALILQAGLQMARHLINDFTFEELNTLSESLNAIELIQKPDTSLLVALQKAIPIALNELLSSKQYLELEASKSVDGSTKKHSE